jgi:hypothetical protein
MMKSLRRVVVLSVAASLLTACGKDGDDRFADVEKKGPYDKVVQENIPSLEKATGLTFKRFPVVKATTADEVRAFAEKAITEEPSASEIRGQEAVYRQLGMLPDSLDLRKFLLDVLEEQIVGLYDPETDVLYVRSDKPAELTNPTIAHEMIHALQDQYLNLDSIQKLSGDNDRLGALKAIIEGQATYEQLIAMVGGSSNLAARLPGGWDRVRDIIREQQASMPVLAASPMIIQETLIFPYLSGAEFAKRFKEKNPEESLLKDLPQSTEQIIHADAYFGNPRDEPVTVTLPAPRTGARVYENNLGEFETRLFLYQHLKDQDAAIRGAAGWDGDRYVLVRTPQGDGIAWLTVWDSPVDGAEFADLMQRLIGKRYSASQPRVSGDTKHYVGSGRSIAITVREIGGRPAVLYVDMPNGASTDIVDIAAIRVQ